MKCHRSVFVTKILLIFYYYFLPGTSAMNVCYVAPYIKSEVSQDFFDDAHSADVNDVSL